MVYQVIGFMSGSSLDGLDLVYVHLHEQRGKWGFELLHSQCVAYDDSWVTCLRNAPALSVADFLTLHTRFGRYIGTQINTFIEDHHLAHKVHFIAGHGHTAFHAPLQNTSFQLGEGATIAATTGLPAITDLRNMDVALGGQGAPIVPIGDLLLFPNYKYLLNIGGIANITIKGNEGITAFDIAPANQILNYLAQAEGQSMDNNGTMAKAGTLIPELFEQLNSPGYYGQKPPKSLSNAQAMAMAIPALDASNHSTANKLHTTVHTIAYQIAQAIGATNPNPAQMLVTGGGAFNTFLMHTIQQYLLPLNIEVVLPEADIITYKEAIVMALIGTLRWREEANVLQGYTGASKDSIGGAIWMVG